MIAKQAEWTFSEFFIAMAPVTIPVAIAGLLTCWVVERFRLFGYGTPLPDVAFAVLQDYSAELAAKSTVRDRQVLIVQGVVAVLLIAGLALHVAEVGLIGLMVIVLATTFTGITEEHRIGKAFEAALPFTALLVVFFVVVAQIHDQHLFEPVIQWVLEFEGRAQTVMLYLATGVLSAISDNVFVASIYITEIKAEFLRGALQREQFEALAVAINTGTNIPSIATPNGQAAFLFLLTSTLAPLIRLGYVRMLWMARALLRGHDRGRTSWPWRRPAFDRCLNNLPFCMAFLRVSKQQQPASSCLKSSTCATSRSASSASAMSACRSPWSSASVSRPSVSTSSRSASRSFASGHDSTLETDARELAEADLLSFTTQLKDLKSCRVFIVTVPTPIDEYKRPDLTPLVKASETVGQVLKKGDVVVYESTVYPGCTEEVCVPILERVSGLKFNVDFYAGYSPERINPGDKEHRLPTDPQGDVGLDARRWPTSSTRCTARSSPWARTRPRASRWPRPPRSSRTRSATSTSR